METLYEYLLNKVENIVTKAEIAHDEHFLLLAQCFQKRRKILLKLMGKV